MVDLYEMFFCNYYTRQIWFQNYFENSSKSHCLCFYSHETFFYLHKIHSLYCKLLFTRINYTIYVTFTNGKNAMSGRPSSADAKKLLKLREKLVFKNNKTQCANNYSFRSSIVSFAKSMFIHLVFTGEIRKG